MITAICNRYYALNERDYKSGMIDADVRDAADEDVPMFKMALERLTDAEIKAFFNLDKNTQGKVFSYYSCLSYAFSADQNIVKMSLAYVKNDMTKCGLDKVPCVVAVLSRIMENLDALANADYTELANGVGFYTNIKKF